MNKFRAWLYDSGMTIKDFCALFSIHRSSVHRWMSGEAKIKAGSLYKIKQMSKGKISTPEDLKD